MNIERLTTIRDYLANPPADREYGFNMSCWNTGKSEHHEDLLGDVQGCDTICCIAGLACALYPDESDYMRFDFQATEILELDSEQSAKLFHGDGLNLEDITTAMAIEAITNLIETGVVVWNYPDDDFTS